MTAAHDILTKAAGHMQDRASTYDKPEGERSMAQAVAIFSLHHGTELTEAQGWHLLQILKDVRLFTRPGYHADSAEDCVAYAALKAEALSAGANSEIPNYLGGADGGVASSQDSAAEDEAWQAIEVSQARAEPRIDSGPMWVEWRGESTDAPCHSAQRVEVELRAGFREKGRAGDFCWLHLGTPVDIVRWREPWPEDQPYAGQGGVMIRCPGCVALSCECRP